MNIIDLTMNVKDLYNIYNNHINNIDNNPDNLCMICSNKLYDNVKLKCNHEYHYNCINEWYIRTLKIECPYCRQNGGVLEYRDDINVPFNKFMYKKKKIICNGKTLKGENCKRSAMFMDIYCKLHKKD